MESSSSPTPKKDDDEKIPTTLAADEGHGDEPTTDGYQASSPRNIFQEAIKAILRCLGFGGENASGTQVAVCEKESDEGQKNVKEDDSSSSPNEGAGDGQGAGSIVSDLPQSSVAYDSVPATTEADDPPAGAAQDDPPAAVATSAFRRPTRPVINPGQGGQTN